MRKYVYRNDRNVYLFVNKNYLKHIGAILKHKSQANADDIRDLNNFMTVFKTIPKDLGQLIYLKYITLLETKQTTDKAKLKKEELTIRERFISSCGKNPEVAKKLDISTKTLNEMEEQAWELLADGLIKEKLKDYELMKHKDKTTRSVIELGTAEKELERLKEIQDSDEIVIKGYYFRIDGKAIYEFDHYKYEWVHKNDSRIHSFKDTLGYKKWDEVLKPISALN